VKPGVKESTAMLLAAPETVAVQGPRRTLWPAGPRWTALGTRLALASAFPLLLLAWWQYASSHGLLPVQILPPPGQVADTLHQLWTSGELPRHLQFSLLRVVQGFLIGGLIGIGLGITMGCSRLGEELLNPLFKAFCQVPTIAWLPLMMLVFGIGEALKIVIITKAVLVPMTINTFEGIRGIPAAYLEVARALQLRRRTQLFRLVFPAVFPPMFSGVRQGLSHSWVALVGVELLASTEGIGYLMSWGRIIFQLDVVFVGILFIGGVGLAMDLGLRRIERRLTRRQSGR
jgi:sulfonate transport system permease protein